MEPQLTLFLVRGLPGSGRTTAVRDLQSRDAEIVHLDADPAGEGEDFCGATAQRLALAQSARLLDGLVRRGEKKIAVETGLPRIADLKLLLAPALRAGADIREIEPAGSEPNDVLVCWENSGHCPSPDWLARQVAMWEGAQELTEPEDYRQTIGEADRRRNEAWRGMLAALSAPDEATAVAQRETVVAKFPREASLLRFDSLPAWNRRVPEQTGVENAAVETSVDVESPKVHGLAAPPDFGDALPRPGREQGL